MTECGIGKQYSEFYKRILQNITRTPKIINILKMTDKTRAGHNTRSMNPRNDKPLRIIKDLSELQMHDATDLT